MRMTVIFTIRRTTLVISLKALGLQQSEKKTGPQEARLEKSLVIICNSAPILQMGKLRTQEGKRPAQDHSMGSRGRTLHFPSGALLFPPRSQDNPENLKATAKALLEAELELNIRV